MTLTAVFIGNDCCLYNAISSKSSTLKVTYLDGLRYVDLTEYYTVNPDVRDVPIIVNEDMNKTYFISSKKNCITPVEIPTHLLETPKTILTPYNLYQVYLMTLTKSSFTSGRTIKFPQKL